MASQDVRFVMAVEDQGFIRKMNEAERALYETKQTAEQTTSVFKQLVGSFVSANIIYDVVRRSARALTDQFKATITAAKAQEDADKSLRAALELTGREVEGNVAHYKKYASELQNATIFADEQVQSVQALLLQMTALNRDGIDRATRGTLGLASALGMDLNAAALLVQKAMAGQFATLSRYGIVLDENLSAEEKREQLLKKLDVLYGRATAATETFSGRVAQLKNAWGDAQEEIGNAVVKNNKVLIAIRDVTGVIKKATPEIGEYIAGLAEFGGTMVKAFADALTWVQKIRVAIGGVHGGVSESEAAWDRLSEKLGGFSGVVSAINQNILRIGQYGEQSRALVETMGDKLWESFNEVGERATLAAIAAGTFGDEAKKALEIAGGESLKAALKRAADGIRDTGEAAAGSTTYVGSLIDRFNTLDDDLRRFRMFGVDITQPINAAVGSFNAVIGSIIAQTEKFKEIEPGLFDFLNRIPKETKKSVDKQTDMWAGFMNNISSGFANAFSQFSLTLEGFKNYFVGIWEAIKNAFFQIIGQMIAKWLVFKVILPFINPSGSILKSLGGGGGFIGMQHGFEGVISRPTPILVGEAGPEYVSVRPMSRGSGAGGGATYNFHWTVNAIDASGVEKFLRYEARPILQEMFAHGDL